MEKIILMSVLLHVCVGAKIFYEVAKLDEVLNDGENTWEKSLFGDEGVFRVKRSDPECTDKELDQLIKDHMECNQAADRLLITESIVDVQIENRTCDVIRAKLDCITKLAPRCLGPDRVDLMKVDFISESMEDANLSIDILGPDFVQQCFDLKSFEEDFIRVHFNSTKCTYEEAKQVTENLSACHEGALLAKEHRMELEFNVISDDDKDTKKAALFEILCGLEQSWFGCYNETIFQCASDSKVLTIEQQEKTVSQRIEMIFRELGLEFEGQKCPF